ARARGPLEAEHHPIAPVAVAKDRDAAQWELPTFPRLIGYKIDLEDDRDFKSRSSARRGVRMLPDQPPAVTILPESIRNPDPTAEDGRGRPDAYIFSMPLSLRDKKDRRPGDAD